MTVKKKIPIPTKQFLRELKAEVSQSETVASLSTAPLLVYKEPKMKTESDIDSDENNESQEIVLDIQAVHEEDEAQNAEPDLNEGLSEINVSPSKAIEITDRVKKRCLALNLMKHHH